MRKTILYIFCFMAVLAQGFAQGGTLMLAVKASPEKNITLVNEALLLPVVGMVESGILDASFERGLIVSSFEPLLYSQSMGLGFANAELSSLLLQARNSNANWLVLVSIETGDQPNQGQAPIHKAQLEIHNLDTGRVGRHLIDQAPTLGEELGKQIGQNLQGRL
jgi:hypothetical protein